VEYKSIAAQTCVVILAAGKGTRMGNSEQPKVCFEIDSVPAINRIITTFEQLRFGRFLLVVGAKAQQVLDAVVADHPEVMYVYQSPQLGTGHAAKVAAENLQAMGYNDNILVTMGDKFIKPAAIEALMSGFVKKQADMALLTVPKTKTTESSGGRVFTDARGQVLDIIETTDLAKQAILDELRRRLGAKNHISGRQVAELFTQYIPDLQKQDIALPGLLDLCSESNLSKSRLNKYLNSTTEELTVGGAKYSAKELEKKCSRVNPSLYLFKTEAYYRGTSMINNDNAQGEYYLTDIVKHLASVEEEGSARYRIRTVPIKDAQWIQGFNSPDELLGIQDYVRKGKSKKGKLVHVRPRLKKNQYCTVNQWLEKIHRNKPSLEKWLRQIYGEHGKLHAEKRKDLTAVLSRYGKQFGYDEKVCIVRAPGRVNLMGRHVDHRGGFNNFLATDRETIAVAGVREDDNVIAVNTQPRKFKTVKFNISELIGRFAWSDWTNFVNSDWVRNLLYSSRGNWGNYIKAATLRLQHKFQEIKIKGINMALSGNVPIAAGLSSSSTLVVATLQAAIALNNFELASRQFIDLCGEGEWFVGSRGGAGDHAAIYLGQRNKIAQVGYLPFRKEKVIEAPTDYQVIIANSHIQAPKSAGAKDTFNSKVAAYNLGLELLKQRCPQIRDSAEYLRDINPEKLSCKTSDIYRMLMKIPQFISRNQIREMLSARHKQLIEENFATHLDPGRYNLRGVLLFGIAEIARSRICTDYLQKGLISDFGKLMNISHDGDRVSAAGKNGNYEPVPDRYTDARLHKLISDLSSEDPQKVIDAQLYNQPGAYACSTQRIDRMVDIAQSTEGVAGAQIAGAGLGGCIMILVHTSAVGRLRKALIRGYYRPNKLKPAILQSITVEGAGLAEF